MKSRFHEAAHAELTEAVAYYDGKVLAWHAMPKSRDPLEVIRTAAPH